MEEGPKTEPKWPEDVEVLPSLGPKRFSVNDEDEEPVDCCFSI